MTRSSLRLIARLGVLALLAASAQAQTAGTPLDGLLRPDGTLDVSRAAGAGALDLDGFDVQMTTRGLSAVPQVSGARAPGDWDAFGGSTNGPLFRSGDDVVTAPDGTVYGVGVSTFAFNIGRVGQWDGTRWLPLGTFDEIGRADRITVSPAGDLYAWETNSGQPLYRWSGVTWDTLGTGSGAGRGSVDGSIEDVAFASNGDIYIVGNFDTAGAVAAEDFARWDGTAWSAVPGAPTRQNDLAIAPDGTLYSSGNGIWSWDGTTWTQISTIGSLVYTIEVGLDGTLYAGGNFISIDGSPNSQLAAWDGTAWSAVGGGVSGSVSSLVVTASGTLFVAGNLSTVGGTSARRVAAWDGAAWTTYGDTESAVNGIRVAVSGTEVFINTSTGFEIHDGSVWSAASALGFNREISEVAVAVDGSVYVSGGFTQTPDGAAEYIAVWNGTVWSDLPNGRFLSALTPHPEEGIVGYSSTDVGGLSRGVLRWDGAAWSQIGVLTDDDGGNRTARSIAFGDDGTMYVGGTFEFVDGVQARGIAQRSLAGTWSALGSGIDPDPTNQVFVRSIAVGPDGTLYAAEGDRVSAWDGTMWTPLTLVVQGDIDHIAAGPSGNLYIAGYMGLIYFGTVEDFQIVDVSGTLAQWDGSEWLALNGEGPSCPDFTLCVNALAVSPDGTVYVEGLFDMAGGMSTRSIAAYTLSREWDLIGDLLGESEGGRGIAYDFALAGGDLLVAGAFTSAGGQPARNIATYETSYIPPPIPLPPPTSLPDSEGWTALGSGTPGTVTSVAVGPRGLVYVGGAFTTAGGVPASRVAVWNQSVWGPLGDGFDATVFALTFGADGTLYAAGDFSQSGATSVNHVAQWKGNLWSSLGSGVDDSAYSLGLSLDRGTLYVGGRFATAGGVAASNVAAYGISSETWAPLGAGVNQAVRGVAVSESGTVYVGGDFNQAGGAPAARVASWDGATWSPLGAGTNAQVYSLGVHADGSLYVGGLFTEAGGAPAAHIARWNGSSWSALGAGTSDRVLGIGFDAFGDVYAAGFFSEAGGAPAANVARWDGAAWSALGSGTSSIARAIMYDGAGGVYIGGGFRQAGGQPATGIARWRSPLMITLRGGEGWRMLAAPATNVSLTDFLGPIWTQGMPGSDAPDADADVYCNVFVHDESVRTDTNNDGVVSTSDGWTCIETLSEPIRSGSGVLLYVYADDDNDGVPEAFPKVLSIAGGSGATVPRLPFTVPSLSYTDSPLLPDVQEGFNYVGNPTPLALDADFFETTNLAATTYVWDPNLFGGDYRTWNGAAGELTNGIVPPVQGFFVQASGNDPLLRIPAAATRTAGLPVYGREAPPVLRLELARLDDGGVSTPEASAFVHLDAEGDARLDRLDGLRLTPMRRPYATLFTSASDDATALVVNALPALPEALDVSLGIATAGYDGDLSLSLSWDGFPSLPNGLSAVLVDTETGAETDLVEAGTYTFTMSASAARTAPTALALRPDLLTLPARRGGTDRFLVRLGTAPDAPTEALDFAFDAPFPNPTSARATLPYSLAEAARVRMVVYDVLGREVAVLVDDDRTEGRHTATLDASGLASGLYIVRLTGDGDGASVSAVRRLHVAR